MTDVLLPTTAPRATAAPTVVADASDALALGTVLGVWAHPDDEAYLSAGLMALAREAGSRVVCVTATRGEHGADDPQRFPPAMLAEMRERELEACLAELGVTEHRFLGLEDGTLATLDPEPHVTRLHRMIAWFRPDTIVTFGPDGMTGHPDHRTVSSWTTDAWRRSGCTGRLLYATTTGAFADENADLHERLPVFGPGLPLHTPEDELALTVEIDPDHLRTKARALRAQTSQVEPVIAAFGDDRFDAWYRRETFTAATC